MRAFIVSSRQ
jgi:calcium-binding protein CML